LNKSRVIFDIKIKKDFKAKDAKSQGEWGSGEKEKWITEILFIFFAGTSCGSLVSR